MRISFKSPCLSAIKHPLSEFGFIYVKSPSAFALIVKGLGLSIGVFTFSHCASSEAMQG